MTTTKLLITEGSAAQRRLYGHYLAQLDCEIETAADAAVCLEKARDWNPDLITLGMELQGVYGVELCRELKQDAATKAIPVVIISGVTDMDAKAEAFEAGAVEYIEKPCTPEFMRARIESVLRPFTEQERKSINPYYTPLVLVAEDSRAIMSVYQFLLGNLGCEVIPCEDGSVAWSKLKTTAKGVDLVISDINMPRVDGHELLKRIRSDEGFDQVPVIMSSTLNELGRINGLLNIGASDFVTKPFSHEEFGARIASHLRTRELMRVQEGLNAELQCANEVLEERVRARASCVMPMSMPSTCSLLPPTPTTQRRAHIFSGCVTTRRESLADLVCRKPSAMTSVCRA